MSSPDSASDVSVMNQQQQQNTDYHNQSLDDLDSDDDEVNYGKATLKNCTVVENGQVVIKPSPTPNQSG